jgi:hypothetical protein
VSNQKREIAVSVCKNFALGFFIFEFTDAKNQLHTQQPNVKVEFEAIRGVWRSCRRIVFFFPVLLEVFAADFDLKSSREITGV